MSNDTFKDKVQMGLRSCLADERTRFKAYMEQASPPRNIDEQLLDINSALRNTTYDYIPPIIHNKQRPWISSTTLSLIEERNIYRRANDVEGEKCLSKLLFQQEEL